ncbi:MAG: inner membrane protein YrbG [Bacteroidota bacterium]|jgi:cation:H+ antiporter
MTVLTMLAGFALLLAGAELLVRGASRIAISMGITPLVTGLTVVAVGTGSPELAISILSSWEGQSELALGNVVGSNIFNILFILGLSALIIPLAVAQQLIRWDVPVMILVSMAMLLFALDGRITSTEGLVLLTTGVAYTWFVIRLSRKEKSQSVRDEYEAAFGEPPKSPSIWMAIGLLLAGLAGLTVGSQWLVDSATALAATLGVSDLVIGLTIVAVGTSLPEVATSVVAGIRGERDIAVGNAVGSNIYNILLVIGSAAVTADEGILVSSRALSFDLPVMVVTALVCLPVFFIGKRLGRRKGALFLGYYIAYTLFLILSHSEGGSVTLLSNVMVWFVIPSTVLLLAVQVARELRK